MQTLATRHGFPAPLLYPAHFLSNPPRIPLNPSCISLKSSQIVLKPSQSPLGSPLAPLVSLSFFLFLFFFAFFILTNPPLCAIMLFAWNENIPFHRVYFGVWLSLVVNELKQLITVWATWSAQSKEKWSRAVLGAHFDYAAARSRPRGARMYSIKLSETDHKKLNISGCGSVW